MEFIKKIEGNKLTIGISGRLNTTTTPELEQELAQSLDGVESLVFDFEKLEYISSSGLRVLLSTHKKMMKQGEFTIINVSEDVMEVLEITGFASLISVSKINRI